MSAGKLIGAIIVVAVVAIGFMSDHTRLALQALHLTHGLWLIGKVAIVVLSAGGLLAARVYKALRPAQDAGSTR
jgi:hypothetical protein